MPKVIRQMVKQHRFLALLYEQIAVWALGNGQPPHKMRVGLKGAVVIV